MEYWTTSVLFLLLNCGNLAEIAKCLASIVVCIPDMVYTKKQSTWINKLTGTNLLSKYIMFYDQMIDIHSQLKHKFARDEK